MTSLYIIRNIKMQDEYIEIIKNHALPFKSLIQDMNIKRTIDLNSYYFGVCCVMIGDAIGEPAVDVVHELLALKFRIRYYFDSRTKRMVFERTSTTTDDIWEFQDYIEKVCAWALDFLHLLIPLPNELIQQDAINEIKLLQPVKTIV